VVKDLEKTEIILLILAIFACLVIAKTAITGGNFRLDPELLREAENKYGKDALARLLAWENMIRQDKSSSDLAKLKKANHFFNSRITFISDIELWGAADYWATPFEVICKQGGDCEDFAIAKYFTLKAMGIAEKKLNITYVKAIQYNMHHMVLTYYSEPGAEPLVLDNLVDSINPASKRTDLMPIFSFNSTALWLAKQRGRGKLVGRSSRLLRWQDLLQKMSENKLK